MNIKSIKPQQNLPPTLDDKIREAAKMYEQQFLQEMIRAMRKTVQNSEITKPSMGEQIYQDQMFDQYAEQWANQGGNGLADVIYRELKEKLLPQSNPYAAAKNKETKKE